MIYETGPVELLKKVYLEDKIESVQLPINRYEIIYDGHKYKWNGRYIHAGPKLERFELWEKVL